MIRLCTSTLETYRRVIETAYTTEQELVDRVLMGQWVDGPSNWMMDAGTQWHELLADPFALCPAVSEDDLLGEKYLFSAEAVDAGKIHIGPGLCEVTGRRTWKLGAWEYVEVGGTADHVHGLVLQDHKTKFSACDPRDYEPSLQWRFYLAIHQAQVFRYNLFDFKDPKENGYCELKDIVSFRLWPYSALESDCRDWLRRFLDWAHSRRLLAYLDPMKEAA